MRKYRIVSNGKWYKIQRKTLLFWHDVRFLIAPNRFTTLAHAQEIAEMLQDDELSFKAIKEPPKGLELINGQEHQASKVLPLQVTTQPKP
jgi:hypothetical protein